VQKTALVTNQRTQFDALSLNCAEENMAQNHISYNSKRLKYYVCKQLHKQITRYLRLGLHVHRPDFLQLLGFAGNFFLKARVLLLNVQTLLLYRQ